MDFNIGAALWLAARGVGHLHDDDIIGGDIIDDTMMGPKDTTDSACASPPPLQPSSTPLQPSSPPHPLYQSAARVVLMGHGADELCGGYGRHRSQFRVRGWQGLQEELQLDMQRLWVRNLGRDDRLVSDHGREARHPFLDEAFVQHVLQLPLWQVADLRQGPGQGDKVLLRNMLGTLGLPRYVECTQGLLYVSTHWSHAVLIHPHRSSSQGGRAGQARHTVWHEAGHPMQSQGFWKQPRCESAQCWVAAHWGCN